MPAGRSFRTRTLAIETATEACSIALFDGTALIAQEHHEIGRGHAETLVPMIAGLPDKGRGGRILVSRGPGSFTGVRIGIATARALGLAWQAQVLGYPTLALIAAMAQRDRDEPVTVCMNGGHGEWFIEDFGPGAVSLAPLAAVAQDRAATRAVQGCVAGNRAVELARLHPAPLPHALALLPDARFVAALPEALLTPAIAPIYGRPPDAQPQAQPQFPPQPCVPSAA